MPDSIPETRPLVGAHFAASVFRRYAADLHRFLLKRLRHPQNADDVAQEVFTRLTRIDRSDLIRKPHSYLFGVAFHVVREFRIREERDRVTYDSEVVDQADEHPSNVIRDELLDRISLQRQLERALASLPAHHRTVLLMCKRDGMTYEEAAAASGISVHMVEKILIQARAKMMAMTWDL